MMPSRRCFAARHLDLVGVTTVHGNNSLENTTRNSLAVVELGDINVPLAHGCAEPLAMPNAGHSRGARLDRPRRRLAA
jgi:inosine-uridine nucleoside N-ribohydrolase